MELGGSLPQSQESTTCPYPSQINLFLCPSYFWQGQLVSFLVRLRTYQHPSTTISFSSHQPLEPLLCALCTTHKNKNACCDVNICLSISVHPHCITRISGRISMKSDTYINTYVNPLTPNDHYSGRTAPLTSKCCILYIYSTNIGTAYFKHGIYSPFFPLQNVVCFIILTYLVPVLFTFYIQCVLKLKG